MEETTPKEKQKLLDLASKKKNLGKAEYCSLLRTINECKDFGNDAESYLHKLNVPNSILVRYAKFLKKLGIPVFLSRESERYSFILNLTFQQTWNEGLGKMIKGTSFIPFGRSEKPRNNCVIKEQVIARLSKYQIPLHIITQTLEEVTIPLIRYVALYSKDDVYIMVFFSKPTNKFEIIHSVENISKTDNCPTSFDDNLHELPYNFFDLSPMSDEEMDLSLIPHNQNLFNDYCFVDFD